MPLAGIASLYSALLFTHNRFAPTAFYQAALNVCTVVSAIAFWKWLGVYAFAAGYAAGAAAQLAVVASAARRHVRLAPRVADDLGWRELLAKPAYFAIYAAGLALNVAFTRAWATHAGAGMAAALDYCMRGVGFPLALLVNPITNSLLPEIARLRNVQRFRDALRLIDRSLGIAALIVIAGTVFALAFRTPAIALFFQHGNFTPGSTQLVAAVFLGLGPSLAGWTLLEVAARSLFALDRPWLPVLAAAIPITVNVAITFGLHSHRPELIGAGASAGVTAAFVAVFVAMHARRGRWAAAA
jgi:putative peptidoglycan lipid II flippase